MSPPVIGRLGDPVEGSEFTVNSNPPPTEPELEAWRERVRHLPGVVVHRAEWPIPFVPDVRVINVKHLDELIGADDHPADDPRAER